MPLGTAALAAIHVAAWLVVGYAFARPWLHRLSRDAEISRPDVAVAAVVGFVGFACSLMVAHIVTGGAVFGSAWAVPSASAGLLLWWWRTPSRAVRVAPTGSPIAWLLLAVVLVLLFAAPVVAGGSGIRTGDPPWHLGWTEQLLAGDPVPTGPAPEVGRNAYPWGVHAVLATLVRTSPGSDVRSAYEALHFVLVFAIPLAAAALAGRVQSRARLPAAAAAALIGGFGWVAARGAAFATSPSDARFGADMVVASPNSVYELFPPGLPRELGLVVLAVFAVVALRAVESNSRPVAFAAGVLAGLCGLVSVPLFVSALVWAGALGIARRGGWRLSARMIASGVGVFALWAGPVAALFARYGGFVDITPRLGREWPLPLALSAWGVLGPLCLAGVLHVASYARARAVQDDGSAGGHSARGLLAVGGACLALLGLAIMRGEASWDLAGNATLLHQGRVWPPAHLIAAVFAGIALGALSTRITSPGTRAVAVVLVTAAAVPSVVLSAAGVARVLEHDRGGFVYDTAEWSGEAFPARAAAELSPDDVVAVEGSDDLAFALWQLSGTKLAAYDDPRLEGNDLRVRYAELAARWDERAAGAGWPSTHAAVPESEVPPGTTPVATGAYRGTMWALIET